MKYLSTQLELIPHISKEKFIEIVGYVHNIADLNSDFVEYKSQYISAIHHQNNNILSFSIYDHDWLYEYVYQYDTHIFYFNIETQNLDNDNCMIDIIQYLIDKHFHR